MRAHRRDVKIRAVAVDIDGTMTDYGRRLDFAGVQAVRDAEAAGIPVMAATGNVAPVTKAFLNFVGGTGPAICENGGIIWNGDFTKHKVLASRRHPDRAVQALRRKGFDARYIASNPWRVSEVALELNLDEARVRAALKGWRLSIVSTRFALHLMDPGVDKMVGLRAALPWLPGKIKPEEVLAIGDSNNDLGLFQGCGAAAAPSNANNAVKAVATYVAKKAHGEGVREAMRHYGVI